MGAWRRNAGLSLGDQGTLPGEAIPYKAGYCRNSGGFSGKDPGKSFPGSETSTLM